MVIGVFSCIGHYVEYPLLLYPPDWDRWKGVMCPFPYCLLQDSLVKEGFKELRMYHIIYLLPGDS